jgi:hypothetical protein
MGVSDILPMCARVQVSPGRADGSGLPRPGAAVHLMRLSRGLTPAVIQNIVFSGCGTLLSVSSARGTAHLYRLALPGALARGRHVLYVAGVSHLCGKEAAAPTPSALSAALSFPRPRQGLLVMTSGSLAALATTLTQYMAWAPERPRVARACRQQVFV